MSQPSQQQRPPGHQSEMDPVPDCGEESYRGSGRLEGRIALITGGDSGIGRAVAIAYAREGADVVISYLDEHDDARGTAELVEQAGRQVLLVPGTWLRPSMAGRSCGRRSSGSGGSTSWSATRPTRCLTRQRNNIIYLIDNIVDWVPLACAFVCHHGMYLKIFQVNSLVLFHCNRVIWL